MQVYLVTLLLVFISASSVSRYIVDIDEFGRRQYSRNGIICISLTVLILSFVSGFRWRVGTDFTGYVNLFYRARTTLVSDFLSYKEPGITLLAFIGGYIANNPIILFILTSIITITLYIVTIEKYSDTFILSILLYMFIGSWHGAFNGIRQYIAAAIVFAGHRYIFEKKLIKYLLVIAIASLFHRTVLIMIPVFFLVGRKITFKNLFFTLIAVYAIRVSYDYLFSIMSFLKGSDQTQYNYMLTEVNVYRVLVAFAPLVMAILLYRSVFFKNEENSFYVMLMVVNAGFMLATSGSAYLARVGIYTEAFATLGLPRIIDGYREDNRKFLTIVIVLLYFAYWIYELYVRGLINFTWWFSTI